MSLKNVFIQSSIANAYDAYYQSEQGLIIDRIEKKLIGDFLKTISGDKLLDLGCGTGHWTRFFKNHGFEVTGIDNSDAMLTVAQRKNLNCIKADAENLPFDNHSFPVVASITMLEFVDNPGKVFDEIYRILKPNGYLILGCLNRHSVLGQTKNNSDTFRHADFFSKTDLKQYLTHFGSPHFYEDVYMKDDFSIVLEPKPEEQIQPVFIAAIVQKIR